MKSSYEVRAKHFVEKLLPFVEGCEDISDFEYAVYAFNRKYGWKVRVEHGQTRIALMVSDYVIKFDYGDRQSTWGGCDDEYEHYLIAEEDGYGYLFAKISPLTWVNGVMWYVMPKVNGVDCDKSCGMDVYEWLTFEENDWLYDHVADIHSANYGWKNKRPVIIDYACGV